MERKYAELWSLYSQSRQGFILLKEQLWKLAETVFVQATVWTKKKDKEKKDIISCERKQLNEKLIWFIFVNVFVMCSHSLSSSFSSSNTPFSMLLIWFSIRWLQGNAHIKIHCLSTNQEILNNTVSFLFDKLVTRFNPSLWNMSLVWSISVWVLWKYSRFSSRMCSAFVNLIFNYERVDEFG